MSLCAASTTGAVETGAGPAVRAEGLGRTIDDRRILHEISFEIPAGRCTALLGANGAGKSTLLRILAGLAPPTSGTLRLFGTDAGRAGAGLRARIGLIGHASMLYRDLTAAENLELFARLHDVPRPRDRARAMLEFVGLTDRADDAVRTFSRGMTQRAAIARALVHDPDLLLADEPFSGLDAPSRAMLETMLRRVRDEGRTVLLASHDIPQSLALAEHVLVLRRGRLVLDRAAQGLAPDEVLREVSGA